MSTTISTNENENNQSLHLGHFTADHAIQGEMILNRSFLRREMNLEDCFFKMNADGTAEVKIDDAAIGARWNEGEVILPDGNTMPYQLVGDCLHYILPESNGTILVLRRLGSTAPDESVNEAHVGYYDFDKFISHDTESDREIIDEMKASGIEDSYFKLDADGTMEWKMETDNVQKGIWVENKFSLPGFFGEGGFLKYEFSGDLINLKMPGLPVIMVYKRKK